MKPDITPTIHSFIIRFVVEETSGQEGTQPTYHGAIRHIQNAEEMNFVEWREAVEFMSRFVPIENLNDPSTSKE